MGTPKRSSIPRVLTDTRGRAALDAANTEDSEILMRKKEAWKNFKRSGDDLEKARPWHVSHPNPMMHLISKQALS